MKGNPEHVLLREVWGLVALHEAWHGPVPASAVGGRVLLHDGSQLEEGQLAQDHQLPHGQTVHLQVAAVQTGAVALLEAVPADSLTLPVTKKHKRQSQLQITLAVLGIVQWCKCLADARSSLEYF